MNIDGLGDKIISQLIEKGIAYDEADIFRLGLEDLKKLDKTEDKSATNLLKAIENSKRTTLGKFIYALGIRHVGEHIADLISKHFITLERIQEATKEEIESISGVGKEIAKSIISYFDDESKRQLIKRLIDAGIQFEDVLPIPVPPVAEKTFVISGTLSSMKRSEAKELILRNGGKLASSVSNKTDYLIVGESPGSKLRKAEDLGITIIYEDEFLKLLGEK